MAPEGLEILGFNPTLVRLRLATAQGAGEVILPFQSHAGSIEAAFRPM